MTYLEKLAELPYRPEALKAGDDIQWLGERYTIIEKLKHFTMTVFRIIPSTAGMNPGERLVFTARQGDFKIVFYRPGGWVTAWPQGVVQ